MKHDASVGFVSYQDYQLGKDFSLHLDCGRTLKAPSIRYETYGELNAKKDNAILIIHALTANHHAAGKYSDEDKKLGWWDNLIGPNKAFDTNRFFVICSNNLGGCSGTTGPNSINPDNGNPYALDFPMITFGDMARLQLELSKYLGIECFYAIAGGSLGGMLALHWSVTYPDKLKKTIAIASTHAQNAQSIAFSEVGRQAIMRDHGWKKRQLPYS